MAVTTPNYAELTRALDDAGISTGASEAHGVICGVLTAAIDEKKSSSWVPILLSERDQSRPDDVKTLSAMLVALHESSHAWLRDANYGFRLLVPDDDDELPHRVSNLADWCSGYLLGLVAGGAGDISALPGDAAEIAKDILRISEVVVGEGMSEKKEKDLVELLEYVRMGVHAVYDEIHGNKDAEQARQ